MKRTEKEIITQICEVYGALSPENLSCDGELPRAEQYHRYNKLSKELDKLFVELGRRIDETEAYDYVYPRKRGA